MNYSDYRKYKYMELYWYEKQKWIWKIMRGEK